MASAGGDGETPSTGGEEPPPPDPPTENQGPGSELGPVDEAGPAEPPAPGGPDQLQLSFGEHLDELRARLIFSLIGLFGTFLVCFHFSEPLMSFVLDPMIDTLSELGYTPQVVFTRAQEKFIAYLKLSAVAAVFVSSPLLLYQAWAFKYDSRLSGINMHADFAAVNVNFWITPDDALEDKDSGGLVVWDKEAPQDWDFDKYNNDQDAMRRFLADNDAKPVRIAYRQNRALVFNSNLFHETDRIVFREGYENRRINITLLYGRRENA